MKPLLDVLQSAPALKIISMSEPHLDAHLMRHSILKTGLQKTVVCRNAYGEFAAYMKRTGLPEDIRRSVVYVDTKEYLAHKAMCVLPFMWCAAALIRYLSVVLRISIKSNRSQLNLIHDREERHEIMQHPIIRHLEVERTVSVYCLAGVRSHSLLLCFKDKQQTRSRPSHHSNSS